MAVPARTAEQSPSQQACDQSRLHQPIRQLQELANQRPDAANLTRLQSMANGMPGPVQRLADAKNEQPARAAKTNRDGLPSPLKAGVGSLSGLSLNNVKVHHNSSEPAALQAQGRVKPASQLQGVSVNDDTTLEAEANRMGAKALQGEMGTGKISGLGKGVLSRAVVQCLSGAERLGLASEISSGANTEFGDRANEIITAAPTVETLQGWIKRMHTLNSNIAFPGIGDDLDALRRARDDFVATCLATPADGPAWNITGGGAAAGPSTEPDASALPAPSAWASSFHSHGDYKGIGTAIAESDILTWCAAHRADFALREGGDHDGSYVVRLDTSQDDGAVWFVTVSFDPETTVATVTHFGPFGEGTSAAIASETTA